MDNERIPREVGSSEGLGPSVPKAAIQALCDYGNARADQDQESASRLSNAIVLLRQWAGTLQAAERQRCATRISMLYDEVNIEAGQHRSSYDEGRLDALDAAEQRLLGPNV